MFSNRYLPLRTLFIFTSTLILMSSCVSTPILQIQQTEELLENGIEPTPKKENPITPAIEDLDGSIVFSTLSEGEEPGYLLHITSPDGTIFSGLRGLYYYPMALDITGKLLATRCGYQSDFLCIVDLTRSVDYQKFPLPAPGEWIDPVVTKIELPTSCQWDENDERFLKSIAWTRQQELVLVCSNFNPPLYSEVWYLTLEGEQEIWAGQQYENVVQVSPSPIEDIYLVISGFGTFVTDTEGNKLYDLPAGMFPAWSPDGSKIAYFAYTNSPRNGVAVYDLETKEEIWLYKQPEVPGATSEDFLCGVCTYDYNGKLSWSPDGSYLVFSANYLGDYVTELFIVNIKTKELRFLIPALNTFESHGPGLPMWSQQNFRE